MILRVTLLVLVSCLALQAKKFADNPKKEQLWQEFEEFLKWKRSKTNGESTQLVNENEKQADDVNSNLRDVQKQSSETQLHDPPSIDEVALIARYIVNQAEWTSVATISTRKDIETFPTANVISVSDGPLGNGGGIPYLYLTPLDFTAQDLTKDHRATLLMTLAQGDYCKKMVWDPMDPRCARIMLTGKIKSIRNDSAEHEIAKNAMFNRHPWLAHMPADHYFFFAKLKIMAIAVLDTFGGPKYVSVKDYLHPPTSNVTEEYLQRLFKQEKLHKNDDSERITNFNSNGQMNFNPIVRII